MAYCLIAPSHKLNQCLILINEVMWHAPESNFSQGDVHATITILRNEFENHTYEIISRNLKDQCVNRGSIKLTGEFPSLSFFQQKFYVV